MNIGKIGLTEYNQVISDLSKTNRLKETNLKEVDSTFNNIINNKINMVNNRQIYSDKLIEDFISGDVEDLHKVMIASQEAQLSLELAVQVRNKIIEAYKELNNMQL